MNNIDNIWSNYQLNGGDSNLIVSPSGLYKVLKYLELLSKGEQSLEIKKQLKLENFDFPTIGGKNIFFVRDEYLYLYSFKFTPDNKPQDVEILPMSKCKEYGISTGPEDILVVFSDFSFKERWNYKFETSSSYGLFFNSDGTVKETDFLLCDNRYFYNYEDEKIIILSIELQDNLLLNIFQPKHAFDSVFFYGISKYFDKLKDTKYEVVNVKFPKFKINSDKSIIDYVKNIGINKIFEFSKDWNFVDWNKFKDIAEAKVDRFEQKNSLIVDGNGAEGKSETKAWIMMTGGLFIPETTTKDVIIDKPFVYSITQKDKDIPIFVGCIKNL